MKLRDALNITLRPLGVELRKQSWGPDLIADCRRLFDCRSPLRLIDGGAHRGETLARWLQAFPLAHIEAFEPAPEAYRVLQDKYAAHPRITLHQVALGPKDDQVCLHVNRDSATNSILPGLEGSPWIHPTGRDEHVCQRSLDSLAQQQHWTAIDLLKLDCQGYELPILQGARKLLHEGRIRSLYTEVNFIGQYQNQCYFDDLCRFLRAQQMGLISLYEGNRAANGCIRWANALFLRNDFCRTDSDRPSRASP